MIGVERKRLGAYLTKSTREDHRTGLGPGVAGLLSALIPGVGQLCQGRTRRGIAMLTIAGLVVAGAIWLWSGGPFGLLSLLVRPWFLAAMLVADIAVFGFRWFAVRDAYRERSVPSVQGRVVLVMLLAFTAVPHVAAAYYDLITMDVLNDLFTGDAQHAVAPNGSQEEYRLTIQVTPNANVTVVPRTDE